MVRFAYVSIRTIYQLSYSLTSRVNKYYLLRYCVGTRTLIGYNRYVKLNRSWNVDYHLCDSAVFVVFMIIRERVGFTFGKQSTSCGNILGFQSVIPAGWSLFNNDIIY
jgi:hypothetical protein